MGVFIYFVFSVTCPQKFLQAISWDEKNDFWQFFCQSKKSPFGKIDFFWLKEKLCDLLGWLDLIMKKKLSIFDPATFKFDAEFDIELRRKDLIRVLETKSMQTELRRV